MTDSTATARRTSYAEVFAVAEFRVLFCGNVAMILSETMRMLALALIVFAATDSAFLSAFAYTAGFLPEVVGGAFLLSLADRLPPRAAIVAGAVVRTLTTLALAALPLSVPAALGLVLAVSVVRPVFGAAASGLVSEVLDGDRYVLGRSAFTVAMSVAQIASLGAGGAVLAWLGPHAVLYVSAAIAAAGGVWSLVGLRPRPPRRSGGRTTVVAESLRRSRELLAVPRIRTLLFAFWVPVSLLTGAESLAVAYAKSRGYDPDLGTVLLASMPIGMLVGNYIVGRWLAPARRERLAVVLAAVLGGALIPIALPVPMWLAFVFFAVASAGLAYELGLQRMFVDALPDDARGQGFGLLSTGMMAGQGVGALAVGGLAEVTGPGLAVAAAGGVALVAALLVRSARRSTG